jgi:hypothetical protein
MKLKNLIAAILPLVLIMLCSCETTEIVDINGNPLSSEETKAYTNAELIYEKTEEFLEGISSDNIRFTQFCFVGELGKDVSTLPKIEDDLSGVDYDNVINYYVGGEADGFYAIRLDLYGGIDFALWSSSLDSELIGKYPMEAHLSEKNLKEISQYALESGEEVINEAKLQEADANAKLLFQNIATYAERAKEAGATFDSYSYSGSLSEKLDNSPDINSGETLNSGNVQSALGYYMGGDDWLSDGGCYTVLLDEQYNPIAALWAKNETSTFVGAFPAQFVSRGFHENGDTIKTADVTKAIID